MLERYNCRSFKFFFFLILNFSLNFWTGRIFFYSLTAHVWLSTRYFIAPKVFWKRTGTVPWFCKNEFRDCSHVILSHQWNYSISLLLLSASVIPSYLSHDRFYLLVVNCKSCVEISREVHRLKPESIWEKVGTMNQIVHTLIGRCLWPIRVQTDDWRHTRIRLLLCLKWRLGLKRFERVGKKIGKKLQKLTWRCDWISIWTKMRYVFHRDAFRDEILNVLMQSR